MRKVLFQNLKIELSDLTPKQKKIELCLIHRVTIQNEISVLLPQINNYDFKSKEIWDKMKEDFEKLCIIVCGYSSILYCSHEISNEQKIKMCSQVLKIVEKMQDPSLKNFQISYRCPIQFFEPINKFYQFFLFKIFPKISQKWRQKTMIQSLSNLCLLGCPLDNSSYINYLLHHLVFLGLPDQSLQKISDDEKIQKINNFWECKNCLLLFNNMQQTKINNSQLIQVTKQKQQKLKLDIEKLMTPTKNVNSQFFDFNFLFYNSVITCLSVFNQKIHKNLIQILRSLELSTMSSSNKLIKKWKRLLIFSISYMSTAFQLKTKHLTVKLLQKQNIFQFEGNNEILPFLIFFCLDQIMKVKSQFHHLFKKIDQIINQNQLSFRFQLKRRYQVSIIRLDFKKMRKIVKFIKKEFSAVEASIQNIGFIRNIIRILFNFLNQYLKSLTNLNEQLLNLLEICYPIVELGAKMVINYFETQKHKKLLSSLVLQKNPDFIQVNITQIENEVKERQLIKQLISKLILVCEIYKKIDSIIKLNTKNNQTEVINILTSNYRFKKEIMPKNHIFFLQQLKKQITFYQGPGYWFYTLFNCKSLQQQVRKFRNVAIRFAALLKQGCKNKQQIYMCNQIIGELFDEIHIEKFDQLVDTSNLPTFGIVYDYILTQLVKSNYDLHWCTPMIKLFQTCWEKKFMDIFIIQNKSLLYIFNCFVYLNSSFQEIKTCFSRIFLFLKQSPEEQYIQNINHVLFDMFWCDCINCFPRKPQNWDHYAFSKYLSETIQKEEEIQNPYMSMVYYYAMKKKTLDPDVIGRLVVSILKSMKHVVFSVREIIMEGLLFPVIYSMYGSKIQQNDFIKDPSNSLQKQSLFIQNDFNIHFIEKNFKNFVLQLSKINCESFMVNLANFRNITRKKSKKSSNHRILHYYGKMIKNNSYKNESLESILVTRFFKEEFIENYYYPSFVKQAYLRKMRKYHELKQNYNQTGSFLEFSQFSRLWQIQL